MAVSNIVVYCGEGGWSVDEVNLFSDSLSRKRQWVSHEGIDLVSLHVLTNENDSLFYRQVRTHDIDFKYEGFWNNIHCLNHGAREFHAEDKVIILPQPILGLDLCGVPLLENVPECGKTENAAKSISVEDKDLIIEKNLFPVQQFENWWNDETDWAPFWLAIPSSTCRFFYNNFDDYYHSIIEDYDSNAYGWQQFIECELEPKLFYLNHPHGIAAPYEPNNKETQLARNELWETNVRPHFQSSVDGYGWRGLGGDEEALLFEYDHEYRAVSRQVSFLIWEGNTEELLKDEYVRWYIL